MGVQAIDCSEKSHFSEYHVQEHMNADHADALAATVEHFVGVPKVMHSPLSLCCVTLTVQQAHGRMSPKNWHYQLFVGVLEAGRTSFLPSREGLRRLNVLFKRPCWMS
jgi:hypothetical protein